jgi:hypothetical protein
VFHAGLLAERPQKVGRGPLRSLRPGGPPRPTRPFAARPAVLNRTGCHPAAHHRPPGVEAWAFWRPPRGNPVVDLIRISNYRSDGGCTIACIGWYFLGVCG